MADAAADDVSRAASAPPQRADGEGRLGSPVVALAIAFAVALYLGRLIGPFARFPGTTMDARFNQVVLEHLWLWAKGASPSLADPEFYYPYRDVLYLSDTHFGSGWIYAGFRALGVSREVAFDLWWLVGMASTFAAAVYAFRRFGLTGIEAAFGACVFAFSLPMLAQDSHAQLVYRFATPLATLACVRFVRAPRLSHISALALWVAWQFLCSVYIGVFLCEWLAIVGLFALLVPSLEVAPAKDSPTKTAALSLGAALALGLAAYMLWRHAEIARAYAIHRDLAQIEPMAPRWTSLLSMVGAPSIGWLSNLLPHHTIFWDREHQLFPGLGVLLLAGAGVWGARERSIVALCVVAALVLPALYLNVNGAGLYRWTTQLPGLNAVRSPGRVALMVAYPLAWLAALGLASLRRSPAPAAAAVAMVGLGLALTDIAGFQPASVAISDARARVAAMERGLDPAALAAKRAALLRFGTERDETESLSDLDLMIAAQDLGLNTFNGYSGSVPPLYQRPRNCAEAQASINKAGALPFKRAGAGDLEARAVIVPPGACGSQ